MKFNYKGRGFVVLTLSAILVVVGTVNYQLSRKSLLETSKEFAAYEQAQNVIDSFFALLTPQQKEVFGDIIEYISYLETTGPKLAHYYGHIIGNKTLYNVVPGYHSDEVLTMSYKSMLAGYWGGDLLTIEN